MGTSNTSQLQKTAAADQQGTGGGKKVLGVLREKVGGVRKRYGWKGEIVVHVGTCV